MTAQRLLYLDPLFGGPAQISATDSAQAGQFSALGVSGVAFQANANLISGVLDPVNPQDAATKNYVDGLAQGISVCPSVKAMSTSNVTTSGLLVVDGYQTVAGDRVLLVGQTNAVTNGIWLVASGAWSRPTAKDDYYSGRNLAGLFTFVEGGSTYASQGWIVLGSGSGTVDSSAASFTQFTGLGEVTAGSGLVKSGNSGNSISVNLASPSGLQFTGGALDTLLDPAKGLSKSATGLGVSLSSNNTLAVDANGLRTLGVPSAFTVAGSAVSTAVTASALNTLTGGTSSYADSLHQHTNVLQAQSVVQTHSNGGTALAAGDPVIWSSTSGTLARADAASSSTALVIGVAAAAASANASVAVWKRGYLAGVLSQATPGQAYFLNSGGGLTATPPSGASAAVVRIGVAATATDLDVNPVTLALRSAS